jgi:hypothetical protein
MEDEFNFSGKWKTTSNVKAKGIQPQFVGNGIRPQCLGNGRQTQFVGNEIRPQFEGKSKTISICYANARQQQFFMQMEDNRKF